MDIISKHTRTLLNDHKLREVIDKLLRGELESSTATVMVTAGAGAASTRGGRPTQVIVRRLVG